jgi:hypothetical protein
LEHAQARVLSFGLTEISGTIRRIVTEPGTISFIDVNMAKFHIPKSCGHPWGDYYDILLNGMSCHLDRTEGLIQLERTGPFVPPISFPGISDIVVTDAFRRQLEASGLSGLRFQPVIKRRIVRLDWHLWDSGVEEPAEYPADGEPESYILERSHSASTANQIGD